MSNNSQRFKLLPNNGRERMDGEQGGIDIHMMEGKPI